MFMLLSAWVGWRAGRLHEQHRFRRFLEEDPNVRAEITGDAIKVTRSLAPPDDALVFGRPGPWREEVVEDPLEDPELWSEIEKRAADADHLRDALAKVLKIRPHRSPLQECPYCKTTGHTKLDCPIAARLN